jgi:hypothetical protein
MNILTLIDNFSEKFRRKQYTSRVCQIFFNLILVAEGARDCTFIQEEHEITMNFLENFNREYGNTLKKHTIDSGILICRDDVLSDKYEIGPGESVDSRTMGKVLGYVCGESGMDYGSDRYHFQIILKGKDFTNVQLLSTACKMKDEPLTSEKIQQMFIVIDKYNKVLLKYGLIVNMRILTDFSFEFPPL